MIDTSQTPVINKIIQHNQHRLLGQPALVPKNGQWIESDTFMVLNSDTFIKISDEKNVLIIKPDPFNNEIQQSILILKSFLSQEILQALLHFEKLSK